jgi:hypothetical protein
MKFERDDLSFVGKYCLKRKCGNIFINYCKMKFERGDLNSSKAKFRGKILPEK